MVSGAGPLDLRNNRRLSNRRFQENADDRIQLTAVCVIFWDRIRFYRLPNIAVTSPSHRLYGPEAKTHCSAKASLRAQYSSIPIGAKPLT